MNRTPFRPALHSILCMLLLTIAFLTLAAAQSGNSTPAWTATPPPATQPDTGSVVPRLISFNGVVKSAEGKPQLGEVKLTFSLYEAQEGGAPLWSETQSVTADDQGRYSVVLGSTLTSGFPPKLFTTGQPRWLGVLPQLDGVTELPRILLVSIPYALKAADADTLGGKPPSAYVLSNPEAASTGSTTSSAVGITNVGNDQNPKSHRSSPLNVGGGGTANFIPLWTDSSNLGNSSMFQQNGNIGIGTTALTTKLSVLANGLNVNVGDWGCGSGFGAVGFGPTVDCGHYALLGGAKDTYVNRPTGGKLYFREGNATQMTIFPGGNVGIGITGTASTSLSVKGNGVNIRVGDFACGTGFGAIGIGNATPSCLNYTLLGDGTSTYLNRPGGGTLYVREGNITEMSILPGGGVTLTGALTTNGGLTSDVQNNIISGVASNAGSVDPNVLFVSESIETGSPVLVVKDTAALGGMCLVDVQGNLECSGSKSAVVPVDDGRRKVALYAVEAPENWFEDFGSGKLVNGKASINLEPTFAQTVNTDIEYHVFLTPKGDCKGLYVASEGRRSVEVRELGGGVSNIAFDYRIVARRVGYENLRLADKTQQLEQVQKSVTRAMSRSAASRRTAVTGSTRGGSAKIDN